MERDVILASKWLNVAKNGRKRRPAPVPMAQTRPRIYHNVAFDLQARIRVEILARMDGAHAISSLPVRAVWLWPMANFSRIFA